MINKKYEIAVSSNFKASVNEDGSKIFIERRFDFKDGDFIYTKIKTREYISVFKEIKDLDIITLGPDMFDIHTPDERLNMNSFYKCYQRLIHFLERL